MMTLSAQLLALRFVYRKHATYVALSHVVVHCIIYGMHHMMLQRSVYGSLC